MTFDPGLAIGDVITNKELAGIVGCSGTGTSSYASSLSDGNVPSASSRHGQAYLSLRRD